MTLTQLGAFVLVARLGSVKSAAAALGVSEPAVSQALGALRDHLGDPLLVRGGSGMTLTPGGARLLAIAGQMVALGAEAQAAVRAARGAPDPLRVVASSTVAEFVAAGLIEAFARRSAKAVDASFGVSTAAEGAVLVANRLADLALGPRSSAPLEVCCEPIFRFRMIVVASGRTRLRGAAGGWTWLVDPSGTEAGSDCGRLLAALGVPESRIRVYPNQTAAWAAAADGAGVAPAPAHLVAHQLMRGELATVATPATPMDTCWYVTVPAPDRRPAVVGSFRRFLATPEAMRLMREPGAGVPPSRFRPPVYVTIWSS